MTTPTDYPFSIGFDITEETVVVAVDQDNNNNNNTVGDDSIIENNEREEPTFISSVGFSPFDFVMDLMILLLTGIALFIALMAVVHVFRGIYSTCRRCCTTQSDDDEEMLQHSYNQQPQTISISEQAGLWGLSPQERKSILRFLFPRTPYSCARYHPKCNEQTQPIRIEGEESEDDDHKEVNANNSNSISEEQMLEEGKGQGEDKSRIKRSLSGSLVKEEKQQQQQCGDDDYKRSNTITCSICLAEYEEGIPILTSACGHIFHYDCAMEWLLTNNNNINSDSQQAHDYCPYCRKEMVQPTLMRIGAKVVLGDERFQQLCCPNHREPKIAAAVAAPPASQ